MHSRLLFVLTCISIFSLLKSPSLHAQAVYELSYWSYRPSLLGLDSNKARKESYVWETYNEQGQLMKVENFTAGGTITKRTVYVLNEYGLPKKEIEYGVYHAADTNIYFEKSFSYNDHQLLDKATWGWWHKVNDSIQVTETYRYNADKQLVQKTTIQNFSSMVPVRKTGERDSTYGTPETLVYSHKNLPDGREETITVYAGNKKKKNRTTIARYDKHGHLVYQRVQGKITRIEYRYDDNGEWTLRKTYYRDGHLSPWVCQGEWRRKKLSK